MIRTSIISALAFLLCSCDSTSESGFKVEFSDGTIIEESDISFYDSSTCILFLEDELEIQYASGERPDVNYTSFSVLVDEAFIYGGIIYPDLVAAPSPEPLFIASISYPLMKERIVQFKYSDFHHEFQDLRNDIRIINALEQSNLLVKGLSCTIDSIRVSDQDYSVVFSTVTITNNDLIGYLIPDPEKMGSAHFNYYTGGMTIRNMETDAYYFPDHNQVTTEWNSIEMDDLSLLPGNEKVTFTFETSYEDIVVDGSYACIFRYGVINHLWSNELNLNQEEGRVWIGACSSTNECLLESNMITIPPVLLDDQLKSYLFKTGSYWIYENDSTGQLDSVVVASVQRAFYWNPPPVHGVPGQEHEFYLMSLLNYSTSQANNYYVTHSLIKINGGGSYGELGQAIHMPGGEIGASFNGMEITGTFPVMVVNGHSFTNVEEVTITAADQYQYEFENNTLLYFSDSLGMIKKEILKDDGTIGSRSLRRWNVTLASW